MGSLSVWHLLIVILPLVIIGSIIGVAVWRSSKTNAAGEPVGFGGWLILVVIGQTLAPLRTLGELGRSTSGYENLMMLPNGRATVYIEVALLLAFAAFQVVVAVAMYRKRRSFPTLFLYQWFAIPGLFILDMLLVSALLGVGVNALMDAEEIGSVSGTFIATGLWVWYIFKSVRVRNTFVH